MVSAKTRRRLWILLAVLLTVGSIWWLAGAVSYQEALAAIGQAQAGPLLAAVALVLMVFLIKAERWRLLLAGEEKIDRLELLRALMAGFVTNSVAPLRAGEVARVLALAGRSKLSAHSVIASVVFEKWLDTLALLLMAGLAMAFGLSQQPATNNLPLLIALAVVLAGLGWWALRSRSSPNGGSVKSSSISATATGFVADLRGALVRQRQASTAGRDLIIIACTLSAFAIGLVANTLILAAYGLETASLWWLAGLLLVALYLGGVAPAPPARLGVYHAIAFATLTANGVAAGPALAIAISMHVITVVVPIVVGLVIMWLPRPERTA